MKKSQKGLNWSLVVIINFLWATQVPVIRLIGERLTPVVVAFIPTVVSTLLLIPFLWYTNKRQNRPLPWRWNEIKYFIIPGLIGIFIMQYAYALGSQQTLAANAGIITLTIPIIVAVLSSFMLKEKLNIVRIISFILAVFGVLLTSVSDISGADFKQGQYMTGNLVFLFASFCCGYYNTYCKVLIERGYNELEILVYCSLVGSIAWIPVVIWLEPFHASQFIKSGITSVLGILEITLFSYGIAWVLFLYVLKSMDVTQAILGSYLMPFFIALMGIVLLGEKITLLMVIGGSVILLSTLLVTVYENRLLKFISKAKDGKIGQ